MGSEEVKIVHVDITFNNVIQKAEEKDNQRGIFRGKAMRDWFPFFFFFERFVNYMVREMREKANKRCTEFLATVEGSVETWAL